MEKGESELDTCDLHGQTADLLFGDLFLYGV